MWREEVKDALNIVTGIFAIETQPIDLLFDSGGTYSFISAKLVET